MRVLLDTNIIIHRENRKVTNSSIGLLYYWLDKLHCEKLIHPYSKAELKKYNDSTMQELYDVKLISYTEMKTIAPQDAAFKNLLENTTITDNDEVDNQLLFEVYCGRADILITEDRGLIKKSKAVGASDKVYSIDEFIEKVTSENPELISYKALSVKKEFFGNIDFKNVFFDTLRADYNSFDSWIEKKCDEEAYICYSDKGEILGFLYLKTEDVDSDYHDIIPTFIRCKRLKIGTFKVESTGFRLGERFLKIVFDNAIKRKVDEIYVTLYDDREELKALEGLLKEWGFYDFGIKRHEVRNEKVLVKKMNIFNNMYSIKENFPNVNYCAEKFIIPIYPEYHTPLLPDSQLKTEKCEDYIDNVAHRYALEKIYVSKAYKPQAKEGDIILFYRIGNEGTVKKYTSVITTIGVIEGLWSGFRNEEEFISLCENRSVFQKRKLEELWKTGSDKLCVIKFLYVCSLINKVKLDFLWEKGVVEEGKGPRPFTKITDSQFKMIIDESKTKLYGIGEKNE